MYYKSLGTDDSTDSVDLSESENSSRSLKVNDITKNNLSKNKPSIDNVFNRDDFSGSYDDR